MDNKQKTTPTIAVQPRAPSSAPPGRDIDQMFFPTHNKPALLGYYFGCAGLLPFIGLPFSFLAIKYGHKGLKQNAEKFVPGARVHAKIGIVLGYLEIVGYILFVVLMIYFYFSRPDKSLYHL